MEKRILIIAMPFSIHTKRWIKSISNLPLEIHFFSSFEYAKAKFNFKDVVYHDYSDNFQVDTTNTISTIDKDILDFLPSKRLKKIKAKGKRAVGLKKHYTHYLYKTIEKIKPDIVHTLESQHAGYLFLETLEAYTFSKKPKWIHSTWGIDLHYFLNFDDHRKKLIKLFSKIDIFCAEGQRDIGLAKTVGYTGKSNLFPSVGGFYEISDFDIATSKRNIVLLKGYQNEMRKGLNGLKALESSKLCKEYAIVIYGADKDVVQWVADSRLSDQIEIKESLSHQEMIELTKKSLMSLTINLSDGLPNSFIEAMACGAFPIQSKTSMADEWVKDGETGKLVDPNNLAEITSAINWVIGNLEVLDGITLRNRRKFEENFNRDIILSRMKKLYFN